ncbi:ArnT family glycosyltransferase [Pandoraea terrae]|nr:glycosyltransferase family 39 protein [Pandoraea terrae]
MASSRSRTAVWLSAALLLTFLVTGLFGRDPWKADEPYSVGMVLNFFRGADLIVPHVAADPFVEKPPVMYWSGAILARLTHPLLPVFEGAQLAVLAWLLLAAWAAGRTAQRLYGGGFGWLAAVLMVGSFGAIENVHKLTADIPQLAGAALALAALVRLAEPGASPRRWGLLLGTGAGLAFLSKGLLVPGVLALTSLVVIVLPAYRQRRHAAALGWAFAAALPWVLIWPWLFWQASHPLFIEWFWDNNFGRFFGFVNLGGGRTSYLSDVGSLVGLTFPAGWLAVGALVAQLRQGGLRELCAERPAIVMLWIYAVLFVATLTSSSSIRDIYMLPIFPALGLLGAGVRLPTWLEKVWAGAAIVLLSLPGLWAWVRWGLMIAGQGHVGAGPLGKWLPLDYPLEFHPALVAGAVVVSGLWIAAIVHRRALGALMLGFAGLMFVWGTLSTLLLPWVNAARGYSVPFHAMRAALPPHGCVAEFNVGESERAMLDYYADVRPVRLASADTPTECRTLIVLDKAARRIAPPEGWAQVWEGGRPADNNERFRVFVRP